MIELDKPLSEREPIELVELNFYRARLHDDNLVRAMEKIQAAGVALVALSETGQPGPAQLHLEAASKDLMHSYKVLAEERVENEAVLKGLASYLELHEVEVFDSIGDLILAQKLMKEMEE